MCTYVEERDFFEFRRLSHLPDGLVHEETLANVHSALSLGLSLMKLSLPRSLILLGR
jgi:hypothetical protein